MDPYIGLSAILLLITGITACIYLIKLKKVLREYKSAKEVIEEIIISFNGDLKEHKKNMDAIEKKLQKTIIEIETIRGINKQENHEFEQITEVKETIGDIIKQVNDLSSKINDIYNKYNQINETVSIFEEKLEKIEDNIQSRLREESEVKAAIPIKKEKALANLTETELKVLQILAKEGEKTASQIREKINLTREHTSRLMKRLYSRGYIERNTDRLPYVYRIKEEMLEFLLKKGGTVEIF